MWAKNQITFEWESYLIFIWERKTSILLRGSFVVGWRFVKSFCVPGWWVKEMKSEEDKSSMPPSSFQNLNRRATPQLRHQGELQSM